MNTNGQWITLDAPAAATPSDRASPQAEGWLVLPPGGRGPGLVLLQEIFGVNTHIRALAQFYALAGYVVLAPDVFWRAERRVELGYGPDDRHRGMQLAGVMQADSALADLRAAVATLRARPEVVDARGAPAKVGAVGWCMGGRLAWAAAAHAGVDAAVAWYGGGIQSQLALAPAIGCPLQFHYADNDAHIPPEAVAAVQAAVQQAGKAAQFHVYPGTEHGFNCWARPAWQPAAAALASARTLQFLAETLQA